MHMSDTYSLVTGVNRFLQSSNPTKSHQLEYHTYTGLPSSQKYAFPALFPMFRGGGTNRAVQMRANTQWFNPDDFDESAYSPQNDAPFRRLGGRDDGNILSGGNDAMHGRGAFPSTRAGAGRGTATGGRVNGRGGGPLVRPKWLINMAAPCAEALETDTAAWAYPQRA